MKKELFSLIGACALAVSNSVFADLEIPIQLSTIEDYGSGPSSLDENLYTPGGLEEGIGLFVGNPNTLHRRDRVMLKYDIKPLLLSANRIKSASLEFYTEHLFGGEETRQLRIKHLNFPVAALGGENVASSEAEEVAVVEVSSDSVIGNRGPSVPPTQVDVTAALKVSVDRGDTSCVFRFEDVMVESSGASGEPSGFVIARSEKKLPILRVYLND